LKPKHVELLSNFAFDLTLRRYKWDGAWCADAKYSRLVDMVGELRLDARSGSTVLHALAVFQSELGAPSMGENIATRLG
jgi:hypothetical protein